MIRTKDIFIIKNTVDINKLSEFLLERQIDLEGLGVGVCVVGIHINPEAYRLIVESDVTRAVNVDDTRLGPFLLYPDHKLKFDEIRLVIY